MEFNLFDWIILAVTGLGLLFGLMWGAFRMVFFAVTLGIAFALWPVAVPMAEGVLDQFVFQHLGSSNTIETLRPIAAISVGVFVPFLVISILLAWPYNLLVKYLNPFINYGVGVMLGTIIGFALVCMIGIIYAAFSEGQRERTRLCNSALAGYVYTGAVPLLGLIEGWTQGNADWQQSLVGVRSALEQANPGNPGTCANTETDTETETHAERAVSVSVGAIST